jgi:hypothetical protein
MKSKMLATIMMTPAARTGPGQRPGGGDVDEHADEREHVRVDAERDARGDDGAQREHADRADEAGEGHGRRRRSGAGRPRGRRAARHEYNAGAPNSRA